MNEQQKKAMEYPINAMACRILLAISAGRNSNPPVYFKPSELLNFFPDVDSDNETKFNQTFGLTMIEKNC
ncbi:MAG: hypothetical protein IPK86_00070 [Neisseriales bacterium]|nr:MAG: hypothetical protein IPK86_00070 [Neisseriales bacterium]